MSASESPQPDRPVVFDTVVINYFLAAGEIDLLARLCGVPLRVPRAVFDPDEGDEVREEAMSELRRGLHLHRRRCEDEGAPLELRSRSELALPEFERLPELTTSGVLEAVDLTDAELAIYADLRGALAVRKYGLFVGLGSGEAAVLAVCAEREWQPATDDNDAVKVAEKLLLAKPLRIRALLQMAVDVGLVDLERARAIHAAMREHGFWDSGRL